MSDEKPQFDKESFVAQCAGKSAEWAESRKNARGSWYPPACQKREHFTCELTEVILSQRKDDETGALITSMKPVFRIGAVPASLLDKADILANKLFGAWYSDSPKQMDFLARALGGLFGNIELPDNHGLAMVRCHDGEFCGRTYKVRVLPPKDPQYPPNVTILGPDE